MIAVVPPIYSPSSIIDYGSKVAWIEAAYNGQLQTPDGTGYLPAVQSLPFGNTSLTKADFESLPTNSSSSAVQSVVNILASELGLKVSLVNPPTLDLSTITLGTPVQTNIASQTGGTVTIDNTKSTIPISNTYTLTTTYEQTVTDEHTNGWSNSTEVKIGNTFAAGFFNKFSSSITNNFTYNSSSTTGTSTTTSVTRSDAITYTVPAGKKFLLEVLYSEVTENVPYTAYLVNNENEIVNISGLSPSKSPGNYQIFTNEAINYAKKFLAPNSDFLGTTNDGTPAFLATGQFTGINGADFTITPKDITSVGTPASVPEPNFGPRSVVGLALMIALIMGRK